MKNALSTSRRGRGLWGDVDLRRGSDGRDKLDGLYRFRGRCHYRAGGGGDRGRGLRGHDDDASITCTCKGPNNLDCATRTLTERTLACPKESEIVRLSELAVADDTMAYTRFIGETAAT